MEQTRAYQDSRSTSQTKPESYTAILSVRQPLAKCGYLILYLSY